jgi:hypothetical protein
VELKNTPISPKGIIQLAKKVKKKATKPGPKVLAINICDSIIRDERTKKVSLIGLFNAIHASTFPARHRSMCIYIALTNGHGKYKLDVRFKRVSDNQVIAGMEGEIEFVSPLQVVELNIELEGLEFREAGEHHVEVLGDNDLLGFRKFLVNEVRRIVPPTKGTEG